MRFLKEKKGIIISFIIGVMLASSITVYAYSYYARDISYTKPGTATEINVEAALNDLYSKIYANSIVSLTSEDKVSSINCSIGDYFFIQTVHAGAGNITGLTGCQVIATCIGPTAYGVDSTGVLVCATSTTISASNQFGYIKLEIQ